MNCFRFNNTKRLVCFIMTVVMMLTAVSFGVSAETAHTVKTTAMLNLRSAPSTSSSVITAFAEGAVMTLLEDSEDGWAHVSASGRTGYVSTVYLNIDKDSDVVFTAYILEALRLREGMGTKYDVIDVIPKESEVKVLDNYYDDWVKVDYDGFVGYVSRDYVVINISLPSGDMPPDNSAHRSASFSGLPALSSGTAQAEASSKVMLSDKKVELDINETHALSVFDESSRPLTGGLIFTSSDSSIASVSSSGVITGARTGFASVTVTVSSTGQKETCDVTVGSAVRPTEAPYEPTLPTEATEPTQQPATNPVQPTQPTQPIQSDFTLSATEATVYSGCYYQIVAPAGVSVSWSSSDTSVATVDSSGIVTAKNEGTARITARSGNKSATCEIKVEDGSTVTMTYFNGTVTAGKTLLLRSSPSGCVWTSGDTSVATVNNGYILAKKAGKTVITATSSEGASTMILNVTEAAPIRFAYTSPNCAAKNQNITLIAITDQQRSAVRFKITGPATKTVDATSFERDGNTLVWKGTVALSSSGTYNVTAYSQYNGIWSTCDDAKTTAFVTDSTDMTTTVCTNRRASDGVISLIANFEGYISSIYDDPITGDPTVGYGRVIYPGQQFYNTMTRTEAFAYLVQTVNNEGYASRVNSFLVGNGVRFNQQQFDALVCLVYNTGAGVITGDTQLREALLDCHDGSSGSVTYYINGSGVRIRKGPGTEYDIIDELAYNTELTLISDEDPAWYEVKLASGTKGYVSSSYISKRYKGGNLDLNYVDRQNLINKFCQYHHAGGGCVYGLLYRRVDEMEMFFYGDYDRNYGYYKYDIEFTCSFNSSFHT